MEFIKRNYKNILIGILFLLFLGACIVIFYLVNDKKAEIKEISGTIIVADPSYVIIESGNENYLISNIKGSYDIGDEVKFSYKEDNIDKDENPKKITINDEELIKKVEEPNKEVNKPMNNTDNNTTNSKNEATTNNKNESAGNNSNQSTNNSSSPNTGNNNSIKPSNNTTNTNPNTITKSADEEVMSYFTNLESDMSKSSIKDSVKSGFITVIDFLFYNGKIKGHTFSELSNSVKLKVLSMALYFDSKIDKYFPGYKESISNTASKAYTNIKEKIVTAYLNLTTSICTNNSDLCASAKTGFNELKTNFGLTFDLIKEIAGDGLTNLKHWYEIWSGK